MARPITDIDSRRPQHRGSAPFSSGLSQSTTANSAATVTGYRMAAPKPLTDFPDEVLLTITDNLSLNDTQGLASLNAPALTCRKMHTIVHDRTRLQRAFEAQIPTAIKLLPHYEWDTMHQAARLNAFQRKVRQVIPIKQREIDVSHPSFLRIPTEGWQNILKVGFLLHAKLRGLSEQPAPHDCFIIRSFTAVQMLALLYSAILWSEVYLSWKHEYTLFNREVYHIRPSSRVKYSSSNRHFDDRRHNWHINHILRHASNQPLASPSEQLKSLRSAFIMEGPSFLLRMCCGPREHPTDQQAKNVMDMYDTAAILRNRWEDLAEPRRSDECWLKEEVEDDVGEWANIDNVEEAQSFEDISIGEEGRTTLLECVQTWAEVNWRDLPWYGRF